MGSVMGSPHERETKALDLSSEAHMLKSLSMIDIYPPMSISLLKLFGISLLAVFHRNRVSFLELSSAVLDFLSNGVSVANKTKRDHICIVTKGTKLYTYYYTELFQNSNPDKCTFICSWLIFH